MSIFGGINSIFKPSKPITSNGLLTDMHSHVIFGLDDGSQSIEESISLLRELEKLGFKKLIATPHIMGDFFKNSHETINPNFQKLQSEAKSQGINIELEFAAEYYLDEWFVEKLKKNERLLTFGENQLLFELSYINPSSYFEEAVFLMKSQGYQPVLAHPERYIFWLGNLEKMKSLTSNGVQFQVNINSLVGYYNKGAQKMAELLIHENLVSYLGTDCHGERHIDALKAAFKTSLYKKVVSSVKNNSL